MLHLSCSFKIRYGNDLAFPCERFQKKKKTTSFAWKYDCASPSKWLPSSFPLVYFFSCYRDGKGSLAAATNLHMLVVLKFCHSLKAFETLRYLSTFYCFLSFSRLLFGSHWSFRAKNWPTTNGRFFYRLWDIGVSEKHHWVLTSPKFSTRSKPPM